MRPARGRAGHRDHQLDSRARRPERMRRQGPAGEQHREQDREHDQGQDREQARREDCGRDLCVSDRAADHRQHPACVRHRAGRPPAPVGAQLVAAHWPVVPRSAVCQWRGRACSVQTILPAVVRRAPQRCAIRLTTWSPRPRSSSLPGYRIVSPTSISFGNQSVGTGSTVRSATLTNTGNADMNVPSISVSGTNAGDFSQTNSCGSIVAAGSNCTISVTFTPTATGTRRATITIADDATSSPQTVTLSGRGQAPAAAVSPASLTFGSQSVGVASKAQTVTLTNTGNASLSLTGIAFSGNNAADFAQTNSCGSNVGAGSSCTISITFSPTAAGTRSATLQHRRQRHRQPSVCQSLWNWRGSWSQCFTPQRGLWQPLRGHCKLRSVHNCDQYRQCDFERHQHLRCGRQLWGFYPNQRLRIECGRRYELHHQRYLQASRSRNAQRHSQRGRHRHRQSSNRQSLWNWRSGSGRCLPIHLGFRQSIRGNGQFRSVRNRDQHRQRRLERYQHLDHRHERQRLYSN